MEIAFRKLTEEEFYNEFILIDNHIDLNSSFDNKMFETFGLELLFVQEMAKQNRVITILESDGDELDEEGYIVPNLYYTSGMHYVNRIGYLISKEPLTFEFEQETFMDEAERLSNHSPGPIYSQKVRCTIMQQDSFRKAHQRVLNVLKVPC